MGHLCFDMRNKHYFLSLVYTLSIHITYIYIYICIYIYTHISWPWEESVVLVRGDLISNIYMYTCMYAYECIGMCVYVYVGFLVS
jgi:hypothetical protein